jgi:hypothetical protein
MQEFNDEQKKVMQEFNDEQKKAIQECNDEQKKAMQECNDEQKKAMQDLKQEFNDEQRKTADEQRKLLQDLKQEFNDEQKKAADEQRKVLQDLRESQNKIIEELNSKFDQRVEEIDSRIGGLSNELKEFVNHELENFDSRIGGVNNELKEFVNHEFKNFDERLKQVEHGAPDRSGMITIGHMKPPEFSGQVPWAVYKRQFEAAANVNHWTTDGQKATALVLALRGAASEVLQTITDQLDFHAIVRAMELRFGNENTQEVHRVQLKTRQQKSGETFQELATDIERLVHLAYPTRTSDVNEETAVDAFIDAIHDRDLKKAARLSGRRKLGDVLTYVLSYVAADDAAKPTHRARELTLDTEIEQLVRRAVQEGFNSQKNQNKSNDNRESRRSLRCWNCGRVGHVQRYCRQAAADGPASSSYPEN